MYHPVPFKSTGVTTFVSTSDSSNAGTATLFSSSSGGNINVSAVTGSGARMISGAGTDNLTGGSQNDTQIEGSGEGNSAINGGAGSDTLKLSTGTHSLTNEVLLANIETIETHASGSTLVLTNQTENFTIKLGSGVDNVTGGSGVDTFEILSSTAGDNDTGIGGTGSDILNLSTGNHTFSADAKISSLETINAHSSGSTLNLTGQSEAFSIVGGADNLTGGSGADAIEAAGNDIISGGTGNDTITGGADNDSLTGGAGNDTFNVDQGTDTILDLGTNNDILVVSSGATANATNISSFTATSGTSNAGTAVLSAASSGGTINMNLSASGAYTLTGGAGVDNLTGGSGGDTVQDCW